MTFRDLVARLESLDFICFVDHFDDDDETRLLVSKRRTTPGNHLMGDVVEYYPNGYDRFGRGKGPLVELDATAATIWFRRDRVEWLAGLAMAGGRSPGTYEKRFTEPAQVYEEVLHYFFDATRR